MSHFYCYTECRYAERRGAIDWSNIDSIRLVVCPDYLLYLIVLNVIVLSVVILSVIVLWPVV